MAHVTRVFKTVHSMAGKTVELAGCKFVDGIFTYSGPERDADNLSMYLNRCWQVEVAGQEETEALVPPAPLEPTEQPTQAQTLGNERLADALRKLDPENDAHWTQLGKPTMNAVEQFYGSADITRADVDAAIPGFNRDTARAQ